MYVRPISTRLLRGMLTPEMRAVSALPLPLLVALVLADHKDPAVAPDDLALLAHRLDRRSYLHVSFRADPGGAALGAGAAPATYPADEAKFRARGAWAAPNATRKHSNL